MGVQEHSRPQTGERDIQMRKPYHKPALLQVPLRPEEAVLGNCKTSGVSGPGGGGTCAPAGSCFSQGS
jgi:hypothetical protein